MLACTFSSRVRCGMSRFDATGAVVRRRTVAGWCARLGLVVSLVALAAVSCASSPAHPGCLGSGGIGFGEADTVANQPYTFGGLVVCLDRPGLVIIDKLVPVNATGGLRIDDWVAVPNPFITGAALPFGSEDESIQRLGASRDDPRINMAIATRVVAHPCPTKANERDRATAPIWFYMQFSKPTDATAADDGLAILYTSGGRNFVLLVPWSDALCGPDRRTDLCGGA